MKEALLQIFAGSLLVMALLSLTEGPMREVVRLGCAAFMVILTVSALGNLLPVLSVRSYLTDLSYPVIESVAQQAREAQQTYISDALSRFIAQQGRAAGGVCTGTVTYQVDDAGVCTLLRADVVWYEGDDNAKRILVRALSHDFGLPEGQIYIREEQSEVG